MEWIFKMQLLQRSNELQPSKFKCCLQAGRTTETSPCCCKQITFQRKYIFKHFGANMKESSSFIVSHAHLNQEKLQNFARNKLKSILKDTRKSILHQRNQNKQNQNIKHLLKSLWEKKMQHLKKEIRQNISIKITVKVKIDIKKHRKRLYVIFAQTCKTPQTEVKISICEKQFRKTLKQIKQKNFC